MRCKKKFYYGVLVLLLQMVVPFRSLAEDQIKIADVINSSFRSLAEDQIKIADVINSFYPGGSLVNKGDYSADLNKFLDTKFPYINPGLVAGDFDGNGNVDYSLLLFDREEGVCQFSVLLNEGGRFREVYYDLFEKPCADIFLRKININETVLSYYRQVDKAIKLRNSAIELVEFGNKSVAYIWDDKRGQFRDIVTYDSMFSGLGNRNDVVEKYYPNFVLVRKSDLAKPLHDFLEKEYPKLDPSVASGDFNGDNFTDYSFLLKDLQEDKCIFVLMLNDGKGGYVEAYSEFYDGPCNNEFLVVLKKGEGVSSFEGGSGSVKLENDAIEFVNFEKSSVVYYWDLNEKVVKTIWTSD